ncbi:MAG: hypothetical protein ACKPHU_17005 [Planctomycetaceae bacterium]
MTVSSHTTDTSAEALQVQLNGFRRMSPQERIARMCAWSQQLKDMSLNAIRRRHPELSESEVRLRFIELTWGTELACDVRRHLQERQLE